MSTHSESSDVAANGDYQEYHREHVVGEKRRYSDLEESSSAGPAVKRINVNIDQKEETFVKFLLPSYVAGIIIGSAGATVAELMESTNTIIKFSPGRELYPGTTERVCVIIGAVTDICIALKRIFGKIAHSSRTKAEETQEYLRHFKMLISNIAAGMAIGKSGQTIKSVQQQCSVKIQISNKDESNLPERMLNIIGESTDEIIKAVRLILEHVREDPDSHKWKKLLTYGSHRGHVSSSPTSSAGSSAGTGVSYSGGGASYSQGASYSATPELSANASSFMNMFQHPSYAALSGAAALQPSAAAGSSVNQALLSYVYAQSLMTGSSYMGQYNPVVVDGVNLMIPGATLASFEIAVPEVMVGAVVGAGGKLITDLMQSTGARIQLSQKGDYFAGTYNRKLTISGPILSVQAAHMVVLQKILKEQESYQKQGLV